MKVIAGPSLWLLLTTLLLSNIHHVHCKRGRGNKDGGEGKRGKKGEIVRGLKPEYLKMREELANKSRAKNKKTTTTEPLPTQNLTDLVHNITNLNHFNRSHLVYEDGHCLALHNYMNPVTPLHILILPKKRLRTLADMTEVDKSMIGHLMLVAHRIGTNFTHFGYRLCINQGEYACEDYGMVMFHLMGHYEFSKDLGFNDKGLHLIFTPPSYEFRESNYFQL